MAIKPLSREEIANTEKKLDMPLGIPICSRVLFDCFLSPLEFITHEYCSFSCYSLDDIIKMSKNTTKPKKQQRAPVGDFFFVGTTPLFFSTLRCY